MSSLRKALVVTVGAKKESLGALKLATWLRRQGYAVTENNQCTILDGGFELYAFSVIFSWMLPTLVEQVNVAKKYLQGEVWIGGPAVTFSHENAEYVKQRTGITPHHGIDERFEREVGGFPMVYFSRGCPAYTPACGFCPVPRIEGNAFRYYPDATPAALLLDNNLSALPDDYQKHIIEKYRDYWWTRTKVDCNSGFEPHSFTEKTLERWKKFPLQCWRFGYDDTTERDQALEMMRLLKSHGIQGEKVRVYTMIGNEPKEACQRRMQEVIDHGMHPWPQRLRPLNWLGGPLPVKFDWDEPTLIAYQRFYSIAGLWKRMKPSEFYYQGRYPFRMCAMFPS